MADHAIFGGCLRSDIPFPELGQLQKCRPNWFLHKALARLPFPEAELLGEAQVEKDFHVRLYRSPRGFRLEFDDTGIFDILSTGSEIVWCPHPDTKPETARLDIMGRVMATALHASGTLCLHGSAVATEQGAIAFLAPKFHGKSTLAMALTSAGARLITDDTLPIDPGPPVMASPGVHRVRLCGDSARRLAGEQLPDDSLPGEKHILASLPEHQIALEPVPLVAIYLLAPVLAGAAADVASREQIPAVQSALMLVRHTTLGPLLSGSESAVVFERAVDVARNVPVFGLTFARDLDRLPSIVSRLLEWHSEREPELADQKAER